MEIEFRDEVPQPGGRRPMYLAFAEELRKRPGQWGKLPFAGKSATHTVTSNINLDRIKALPAKQFEARTFEGATWVRFKGEDADA